MQHILMNVFLQIHADGAVCTNNFIGANARFGKLHAVVAPTRAEGSTAGKKDDRDRVSHRGERPRNRSYQVFTG
jgi:hypothetical protein